MGRKDKRKDIVTLCGSTRYKDTFLDIQEGLTLSGHIVLSPGVYGHADGNVFFEHKGMLDELHKRKIDLSGWIYVINPELYFGVSTWSEISYAWMTGKGIAFLEGAGHIQPRLAQVVEERIDTAKKAARWNLAYHQRVISASFDEVLFPSFKFHGKAILDPWAAPEVNAGSVRVDGNGTLCPDHAVEDPFAFYGRRKVARFIEHLLTDTMGEEMERWAREFYEELRREAACRPDVLWKESQ